MKRSRPLLVLMLLVWPLTWPNAVHPAKPAIRIAAGAGSFLFVDEKGDPLKPMTIYTYLPNRLEPASAPIVFVMHGHGKNARGFRDTWVEHADRYRFMVLAPLFARQN